MKQELLYSLVDAKLKELRESVIPDEETGEQTYKLYNFCVEVVPEGERQSKHIDILEYLMDQGVKIRWVGLKFQPKNKEDEEK